MSIFEGKQRHRFRWLRHLNGMHEILFTGDFNGRNGQLRLFVIFFKRLQWRRQFGNGGGHWSLRPNGSIVLIYPISVVDIGTVNLDWNSGGNNPRQGRSDTSLSLSKAFFSVFFSIVNLYHRETDTSPVLATRLIDGFSSSLDMEVRVKSVVVRC